MLYFYCNFDFFKSIKMKKYILLFLAVIFLYLPAFSQIPKIDKSFKKASVKTTYQNELVVNTGKVSRTWQWTGNGFVTTAFSNSVTGKEWSNIDPDLSSDWALYGIIDDTPGELVDLKVHESNDEGLANLHLEVLAEVEYPSVETTVKYQIWVYPNAPGIRTQVWLKGKPDQYYTSPEIEHPIDFVEINLSEGHNSFPYMSKAYEMPWYASVTRHKENVKFTISNLDRNKEYFLGVSWWDYGENKGGIQKVRGLNPTNGRVADIINERRVPYFKYLPYEKWERAETVLENIPSELIDDSLQIIVDNVKGKDAVISELWIYEKSTGNKITDYLIGDRARINQLIQLAPEGYQLVGYFDSGHTKNMDSYVPNARVDYLPLDGRNLKRRYFGYNNDTQNRHTPMTHMLEEKINSHSVRKEETVNWASGISIEDEDEGVIIMKESHKTPNQYGVGTGNFTLSSSGLVNTGTPLNLKDIEVDKYNWSWASWMIAYQGGDDYRELAIKEFDRLRFPIHLDRDVYVKADTWGGCSRGTDCRVRGVEVEVLDEIESVADLGIDILQIDDGWQRGLTDLAGMENGWKPHPDVYPENWKNVKEKAKEFEINLGTWAAAYSISLEELKWNYDQVGFITWKLDFGIPQSYHGLNTMLQKARDFSQYTDHNAQISWDITENDPRLSGYYFGREFGGIWWSNRKPKFHPRNVPQPWLMLRENWELSKYVNINKFQLPVKNFARVDKNITDAHLHSQSYAVALGMPGTPVFFQTTRYYEGNDRNEVRNLLSIYKNYQKEMFDSYVFPIGEEPTNDNWAGFQWYHPEKSTGYLLLFREINNDELSKRIQLRFLKEKNISFTNVMNEKSWNNKIDSSGKIKLSIEDPGSFIFLKMNYD